jgi:ubiquinone/menaquinone biosynthesis C-methylase UbiE
MIEVVPSDRVKTDHSQTVPTALKEVIRSYWNERIHDLEMARHPVGTRGFFDDLEEYRFDKLDYLPRRVDFSAYQGQRVLEIGCGLGIDLVRFARGGAEVTGVDLAERSIELARKNLQLHGLRGRLEVMDGEALEFADGVFDVVYAHGILQYTADTQRVVDEAYRVLKSGGEAIFMVYNRFSWLNLLSKIMNVSLEHEDAPVLKKYSRRQFSKMLAGFSQVTIVPERFPVTTRLHHGIKGGLYNKLFVPLFNAIPRSLVRWLGWHIMAFCVK